MAIQRIFQYIKEKITGAIKRMNNGEKNLKNAEVANEKIQQEKRVKKVNHIGLYENRELSWLKFNERVLEEAEDTSVPLCERMTFLSIFQSNLDEFFMVRVGSLEDQKLLSQKLRENKTNMTAGEQIEAILKRVAELNERKDAVYASIMKEVGEEGVHLTDFKALAKSESKYLEEYFMKEIVPLLSVMIVGRKQPFPFLKGQEIYALAVLGTRNGKKKIGIIPCSSSVFPRLIRIPTKDDTYMLVEELILHFLPKVYKDYKVLEKSVIRVTRNADIDFNAVYDEDLDYRDKMAQIVKLRKKLAPVRLELSRDINEDMIKQVCEYAEMEEPHVFLNQAPLDLSFLFQIEDILRKDANLVYQRRVPQPSPMLKSNEHIIPQILDHDVLLSYPYESIKPFLQMLQDAARDPEVISIRMTLYRLARNSKVVEALTEAAENGKQVDVLVELKARFDEANNIEWSRTLEDAGCHVVYGIDGLKVHSKLCLITRKVGDEIQYITQVGTGNYNEKTSRLYTDLSLITADKRIGEEAAKVFQAILLGSVVEDMEHLLVAPKCLQNKILAMIENEIQIAKEGKPAYIGIKINSLTDKKIIDKLIDASRAGVKIDMVIRGINCLRSGIPGDTDNIHIVSIVGRFLEHSRIYIFGTHDRDKVYIASADFMTRNTLRRVEVAAPLYDETVKNKVRKMFATMLRDNVKAREQQPDGSYQKLSMVGPVLNSQEYFYEEAYMEAGDAFHQLLRKQDMDTEKKQTV
ncbi:polyphosphate kinase 1 [Coprococcus eutactus]|jgi:polyphosphate kinase|nr:MULTISPECIES: polyphosphate kinase 1 [Clostridia]MCB5503989.1 polyphosphate kinase 1 [Coprococcus eutactus]NSC95805.1 polyphosphate kinase 1 [Coprococcus eutactus]NSD35160.1 polyphosphate kinase 1 [Coprococcus eutactus]RHS52200.1 polyphosphate kinase 1 [Clostridium sp. AM46-21]